VLRNARQRRSFRAKQAEHNGRFFEHDPLALWFPNDMNVRIFFPKEIEAGEGSAEIARRSSARGGYALRRGESVNPECARSRRGET
jgi:hypothetical protein